MRLRAEVERDPERAGLEACHELGLGSPQLVKRRRARELLERAGGGSEAAETEEQPDDAVRDHRRGEGDLERALGPEQQLDLVALADLVLGEELVE